MTELMCPLFSEVALLDFMAVGQGISYFYRGAPPQGAVAALP